MDTETKSDLLMNPKLEEQLLHTPILKSKELKYNTSTAPNTPIVEKKHLNNSLLKLYRKSIPKNYRIPFRYKDKLFDLSFENKYKLDRSISLTGDYKKKIGDVKYTRKRKHINKELVQKKYEDGKYVFYLENIHNGFNFYSNIKGKEQDLLIQEFEYTQKYYYVRLIGETWFRVYVFDEEGIDKLYNLLYDKFINICLKKDNIIVDANKFVTSYSQHSYVNNVHSQLLDLFDITPH